MGSRIMQLLSLCLYVCLHSVFTSSFTPPDNYLVNCGSNTNVSVDNRVFVADGIEPGSVFLSSGESVSVTNPNPSSISSPLYGTARIFKTASAYTFKINKLGTHLVRLHFSPFVTEDYNLGNANFSVSANGLLVLSHFSAKKPVFKEFVLMADKVNFEVLFVPDGEEDGLGFVCAIEVFSTPDDFILDNGVKLIGPNGVQEFKDLRLQTLETIHRINVGGPKLTPFNDTLWRTWVPDEEFLVSKLTAKLANTTHAPNYQKGGASREIAPDNVYMTAQQMNRDNTSSGFSYFNVTWDFPVGAGSVRHFVRLHFCDIVSIALNQLYFDVYINEFVAYKDVDLSSLTFHSLASPYYIDFVVDSENSRIVRVSIGPSDLSNILRKNAILNGVEIMRIVNFVGIRAESKKINKWILVGSIVGGVAVVCLAILAVLAVLRSKRRKAKPRPAESTGWTPLRGFGGSSLSKQSIVTTSTSPGQNGYLALKIPFAELESGTNNFDKNLVIGSGGFGMVYKGVLKDSTRVAVKRGVRGSRQGLPEFQTEITILSKIRHRHLVSLVGYCEEQSEMILVYEYMEKGALKNHLYGSNLPPLSWKQRLEICIGAARGLHYLHTGSAQGIIHRDIKSTNILLDENYVAKVADFGLSRSGPCLDETHVSTGVKGSFGYLDPEYFRRQQLTDKSDVYSFGVVLFEVLCARPAVDPLLEREQVNLAEWAMEWQKKGLLAQIIDPNLVGNINSNSLKKLGETAEKCLAEYGVDRPTMGDVLWNLEYALQLQDSKEPSRDTNLTTPEVLEHEAVPTVYSCSSRTDGDLQDAATDVTSGEIFSQLVNKEGR